MDTPPGVQHAGGTNANTNSGDEDSDGRSNNPLLYKEQ